MADNFFGFDTEFPSGTNVLGRQVVQDVLLTGDVEEEYDALNDETFGQAANDDWEEAHEKLSELIKKNKLVPHSVFNDTLLENDESQDEIVSKSISQLGLEDDLDDPAIMTVARNCHLSSRLGSVFGPSPPPPAILETEICGSPKTRSIWSTTPKDSGISSILQSLSSSSSLSHLDSSTALNSSSDSVFSIPCKAWRAEELERNLLASSNPERVQAPPGSKWPQVSQLNSVNHQNFTNHVVTSSQFPTLNQNQNKSNKDRMLTREEVERHMHSDRRLNFPPNVFNHLGLNSPLMRPNMMSPIGTANSNGLGGVSDSHLRSLKRPMLENVKVDAPFLQYPIPRMGQLPLRGPPLPNLSPRFTPPNVNLTATTLHNFPRAVPHPLMYKYPAVVNGRYPNNVRLLPWQDDESQHIIASYNKYGDGSHAVDNQTEDEYAGLMTQKEKEWLVKIQMLLLKFENPYVEDYYYTTQLTRKCKKKYSETATKGGGDAPELILPETTKHESKTYVPTQFEGSLGKLQAVSVNFPRRVLDIKVARPLEDDEGRVVTNQSLMRYRRLLLDIEKLYSHLLDIEDEERRILAKPDNESEPHRKTIEKLTKNIFNGLFCDNSTGDSFSSIAMIRKGRSLIMRAFKIFNKEQQLHCLIALFRYLPLVLKKDQNDHVLEQHCKMICDTIQELSISDMVLIGEALKNGASSEPPSGSGKEKSNFITALKNKFGSSVICSLLLRAENLYSGFELFETDIEARWAKVVIHLVDCLCSVTDSSLSPPETPCSGLIVHFQRFAVDRDKFEVLKEKLAVFEGDLKNDAELDSGV
ncbi:protein PAT1 homolog 1-like [Stegodyphus dumicola]|uniref:protein PAT1 homolog 1-like n=1 Tax=Stegodyphus dumicola TaxID=202533 RepID=UPI0015B08ADD|nr:protein PAT1 homolog 1-like [Stegodyphus dumicola]